MTSTKTLFTTVALATVAGLSLAACSGGTDEQTPFTRLANSTTARVIGTAVVVRDTVIDATIDASGVAEPIQQAALSTKLMGTVTAVLVREGDVVRAGQTLLRIDARDLTAKAAQVGASIADAEAQQHDAATQVARIRALYTDSAATRAQLDAAETGLARAVAGLRAAQAAAGEMDALRSYATVIAPFAGVVTSRAVDPGAFAAPGAPLITVQDGSSLRISVSAAGDAVRELRRGQTVAATIDGVPVSAVIEGVVPAGAGNLFTVNATVANQAHRYRTGSAAMVSMPVARTPALLVPNPAIVREGDLTGVIVRTAAGDERRWVRLGASTATHTAVSSGLKAGETIVIPSAPDTGASQPAAR
ncbi:efflux RND transporter periplasmic adaptor subunit [Gemmatimonas sp.]|uniref:efflux RND transporter periplasmic adaptor subunit n=1 Tax=Gemmatimonas sp. TaxID=1962908 RepID=UPI00398399E7